MKRKDMKNKAKNDLIVLKSTETVDILKDFTKIYKETTNSVNSLNSLKKHIERYHPLMSEKAQEYFKNDVGKEIEDINQSYRLIYLNIKNKTTKIDLIDYIENNNDAVKIVKDCIKLKTRAEKELSGIYLLLIKFYMENIDKIRTTKPDLYTACIDLTYSFCRLEKDYNSYNLVPQETIYFLYNNKKMLEPFFSINYSPNLKGLESSYHEISIIYINILLREMQIQTVEKQLLYNEEMKQFTKEQSDLTKEQSEYSKDMRNFSEKVKNLTVFIAILTLVGAMPTLISSFRFLCKMFFEFIIILLYWIFNINSR